jgi:hypothetical protein
MIKIITGARLRMQYGTGGQREERDLRIQRESVDTLSPPVYEGLNPI